MESSLASTNEAAVIEFAHVGKAFPGQAGRAVSDVSLSIARGELLVLVGESGSGKSTLLKMINRLIIPDAGHVSVHLGGDGPVNDIDLRRRIGYVVQGVGLLPHLSVRGNVAIVPELLGVPRADIDTRVDELLSLVRLDPSAYRHRRARELSGGQAQRVGLARALAGRPPIVLMDEPFGALDPVTRGHLQIDYRAIHDRLELTTVMVTHDLAEAALMADRIAILRHGRLVRVGTPAEVWSDPRDPYAAELVETPRSQAVRLAALVGGAAR